MRCFKVAFLLFLHMCVHLGCTEYEKNVRTHCIGKKSANLGGSPNSNWPCLWDKHITVYFFLIVWEPQIFSWWTQRWRIYEEMLYESGPISLLSEIYPHSSEMQPSTFNKKKPPFWILNFIHFNLPFLSTQIQTYSTCFVKTLIDLWKLQFHILGNFSR